MGAKIQKDKYSYFVNAMLFLFALFVNIHNTLADIALFSLAAAGMYILKKNNINLFKDNNLTKNDPDLVNLNFVDEDITINQIDYYYSNAIARASKTMFNCRSDKIKMKQTGTQG